MFYLKTKINDQIEMKIDIYDDEIFTLCLGCGEEQEVDTETLIAILRDGGDFSSTSIFCKECTEKLKEERK